MSISIEEVEGGYLARIQDTTTGEYELIDSTPRTSESISELLHKRGYDQRDIIQALTDADPNAFSVGRW